MGLRIGQVDNDASSAVPHTKRTSTRHVFCLLVPVSGAIEVGFQKLREGMGQLLFFSFLNFLTTHERTEATQRSACIHQHSFSCILSQKTFSCSVAQPRSHFQKVPSFGTRGLAHPKLTCELASRTNGGQADVDGELYSWLKGRPGHVR